VSKREAQKAAEALANLATFASVERMVEGGGIHGPGSSTANDTARKIIRLCQEEQQRQLRLMDAAMERVTSP